MEMQIIQRSHHVSHVALSGRLDATSSDEIEAEFAAAVSERDQPAMIDVSGIEFMASRGIALLFTHAKRLMKNKHKLVILNPHGMVDVVLKSSKMDKVMPIAYSEEDALSILLGEEAAAALVRQSSGEEVSGGSVATVEGGEFDDWIHLPIKNEMSEFDQLNATVAQFLAYHKVPHRVAYGIDLAIEELVMNVLRYAYIDDDEHTIDLNLGIEGEQIILRIEDDGREFDPRRGPALDLHAEDREVGGLGLILVLDLVDVLNYRREDEKNKTEVRIHILPDADEETAHSENEGSPSAAGSEAGTTAEDENANVN